jgi:hypothetical protein
MNEFEDRPRHGLGFNEHKPVPHVRRPEMFKDGTEPLRAFWMTRAGVVVEETGMVKEAN